MVTARVTPTPRPIDSSSIDGIKRVQIGLRIEFAGGDSELEIGTLAPDGLGKLSNGCDGFETFRGIRTFAAFAHRLEINAFGTGDQMEKIEIVADRACNIVAEQFALMPRIPSTADKKLHALLLA